MFNKVILIGNLTRDVDLRYIGDGTAVAKFGLAVNKKRKDRNTGDTVETVMYIDISIWGRAAEIANQHLGKGRRVLIEGELVFEQWQDQNGQKRSKHTVAAQEFKFLDSRESSDHSGYPDHSHPDSHSNQSHPPDDTNNSSSNHPGGSMGNIDIDDDDIPF